MMTEVSHLLSDCLYVAGQHDSLSSWTWWRWRRTWSGNRAGPMAPRASRQPEKTNDSIIIANFMDIHCVCHLATHARTAKLAVAPICCPATTLHVSLFYSQQR